ncbi:MAG: hypothetical protein WC717_03440 [Candidatus Micrarchaeia archaeon]|jgi:hypothetical protein
MTTHGPHHQKQPASPRARLDRIFLHINPIPGRENPLQTRFPASFVPVDLFMQSKDKLLLQCGFELGKAAMSEGRLPDGDYKLVFKSNGKQAAVLDESQLVEDRFGFKVISGEHGGKSIQVLEARLKKAESIDAKSHELESGQALAISAIPSTSAEEAEQKLLEATKSGMGLATFGRLGSLVSTERLELEKMIFIACGGDHGKAEKAKRAIAEMGRKVEELENAKREAFADNSDGSEISIGNLLGNRPVIGIRLKSRVFLSAAREWPFAREKMDVAQLVDLLYDELGKPKDGREAQRSLSAWSKDYLTRVLREGMGVPLLEHTSIERIREMQLLLARMHSRENDPAKQGRLSAKIEALDGMFRELNDIVLGLSSEQEEVALQASGFNEKKWIAKLFKTIETRKKLFLLIEKIEDQVNGIDHTAPYRGRLKKLAANIAFNLCRASMDEAGMWQKFSADAWLSNALKSAGKAQGLGFKNLKNDIIAHARLVESEAVSTQPLCKPMEKGARDEFKERRKRLDGEIDALIKELGALAPALGKIYKEKKELLATHSSYKQGDQFSRKPIVHLSPFLIACTLADFAKGNEAERKHYSDLAAGYLENAAELFSILASDSATLAKIMSTVEPARYVQPKGFDLVSDTEKLAKSNSHAIIEARYEVIPSAEGLSFEFSLFLEQKAHGEKKYDYLCTRKISISGAKPHEWKDYNEGHASGASAPKEDVYGKLVQWGTVFGARDAMENGLAQKAFYKKLYEQARGDPELYSRVWGSLLEASMENPLFLSTLGGKNRYSGCIVNVGGEAEFSNLPLKLGDLPDGLTEYLRMAYPDYDERRADLAEFMMQQVAKKAVSYLVGGKYALVCSYVDSIIGQQKNADAAMQKEEQPGKKEARLPNPGSLGIF